MINTKGYKLPAIKLFDFVALVGLDFFWFSLTAEIDSHW